MVYCYISKEDIPKDWEELSIKDLYMKTYDNILSGKSNAPWRNTSEYIPVHFICSIRDCSNNILCNGSVPYYFRILFFDDNKDGSLPTNEDLELMSCVYTLKDSVDRVYDLAFLAKNSSPITMGSFIYNEVLYVLGEIIIHPDFPLDAFKKNLCMLNFKDAKPFDGIRSKILSVFTEVK